MTGIAITPEEVAAERERLGLEAADQGPDDALIIRLAELDDLAYYRSRKTAAEALSISSADLDKLVRKVRTRTAPESAGGSVMLFEDMEPWPMPVDGAVLLLGITATIQRFTVLSPEQARACALWVAFTWFVQGATVAPLLNITSPEKRCGKSTLLSLLSDLVARPLMASNISPAAIFRTVEKWSPTLLIDEVDTFLADKEELRGILNAGHYRKTAYVIRTVGDEHEPRTFCTWCPKLLAGIGRVPDTIRDRSIVIELRRKLVHEKIENVRHASPEDFLGLRRQLQRWAADELPRYARIRPEPVAGINDRAADNWEPLMALALLAGGDWPEHARLTAQRLSGLEKEAPSINAELLADIKEAFELKGRERLFTAELLESLCADEEKPWATWNRGKPISPHQLSKRLQEFGVRPDDVRIGALVRKGYKLEKFSDAFARYLMAPATALQAPSDAASMAEAKRYTGPLVAPVDQGEAKGRAACSAVALSPSDAPEVVRL